MRAFRNWAGHGSLLVSCRSKKNLYDVSRGGKHAFGAKNAKPLQLHGPRACFAEQVELSAPELAFVPVPALKLALPAPIGGSTGVRTLFFDAHQASRSDGFSYTMLSPGLARLQQDQMLLKESCGLGRI